MCPCTFQSHLITLVATSTQYGWGETDCGTLCGRLPRRSGLGWLFVNNTYKKKKKYYTTASVFRFSVYTVQSFSPFLHFVKELRVAFSIKCVPCVYSFKRVSFLLGARDLRICSPSLSFIHLFLWGEVSP